MVKKSKKTNKPKDSRGTYSPLSMLKKQYFKRSRVCSLSQNTNEEIDYKNIPLLTKYISPYGRILPSRITSVSSGKQKILTTEIKKARYLSLLPYSSSH